MAKFTLAGLFTVSILMLETEAGNNKCGSSPSVKKVKIPKGMPMADFDAKLLDKHLNQILFATKDPNFKPFTNAAMLNKKVGNHYTHDVKGNDTSGGCGIVKFEMTPQVGSNTAVFNTLRTSPLPITRELQVFWTDCADKYVLVFYCKNWSEGDKKCPVANTVVAVYYTGQEKPQDVPLADACKLFFQETGFELGSTALHWWLTYGEFACS